MNKPIFNDIIPFKGFIAMMLYGKVFWRNEYRYLYDDPKYNHMANEIMNHESIHIAQMKDFCKWIPVGGTIYYALYICEYLINLIRYFNFIEAYENISFEIEAYNNESNLSYLESRKRFAMWKNKKQKSI